MTKYKEITFYAVLAIWTIAGIDRIYTNHKALKVEYMHLNGTVQISAENAYNCSNPLKK